MDPHLRERRLALENAVGASSLSWAPACLACIENDQPPPLGTSPCSVESSGASGAIVQNCPQPELVGDRLQRCDDVRDVLVEVEAEQLRSRIDLIAVHARRER